MYTFKRERGDNNPYECLEISMKTDDVALSDLITNFSYFLKACGYEFEDIEVILNDRED